MACNKYNNCHYKSSIQRYNTVAQPITAANIVTNPVVLNLGTVVTDTGVAIDDSSYSDTVESSGLYRLSAIVSILGVVAGSITVAITLNGVVLPETTKEVTVAAADTIVVPIETVRLLKTCCNLENYTVGYIAYSDATATGSVTEISSNVVKLA